jgi:hypothetical protein
MALSGGTLQAFWARTHERGSLRVVVASPASPELVVATLRELGRPGPPTESLGLSAPQELPPPETQVLRQWLGRAYLIPEPDDPRGAILAALLGERLDEATEGFGHEHWVELRQTRSHQVLVLSGAAYAAQANEMRRHIRGMLETVASSLSEGDVVRLRTRFLRAALESAATPAGRVEFVGRHYDASGSFARGADYLAALDSVDVASLEALARELLAAPPAELEIR